MDEVLHLLALFAHPLLVYPQPVGLEGKSHCDLLLPGFVVSTASPPLIKGQVIA